MTNAKGQIAIYQAAAVAKNATAAVRPVKVGNFDMTTQEKIVPPIAIYQAADGSMTTEVRLEGETVWLSQKQMAELFDKNIMTVNEHIANVFAEGELEPSATIRHSLWFDKRESARLNARSSTTTSMLSFPSVIA